MILTKRIFLDETAWYGIINGKGSYYANFKQEFQISLNEDVRFFTSNIAVGNAMSQIKKNLSPELSFKFNEILDEAVLGNHLRILWIGRRTQKEAIRSMRKHPKIALHLYDFAHAVLMERRRINTIMSEQVEFKKLGFTVLPEIEAK